MSAYLFSKKYFWNGIENLNARNYRHEKVRSGEYYWVWHINESFPIYTHETQGKISKLFIDATYHDLYLLLDQIEGVIPSKRGAIKNQKFEYFKYSKPGFDGTPVFEGWKFNFSSEKSFENFLDLCEAYAKGGIDLAKLSSIRMELKKVAVTSKLNLNKSRIGQSNFRSQVLRYWRTCAVTGCSVLSVLKASHIKPWANSLPHEQLDTFNGLLLIANLDALFDCGLISFSDEGAIQISSKLDKNQYEFLGVNLDQKLRKVNTAHLPYLKYHRAHVFVDSIRS